jgi:hypothetical protein
MNRKQISNNPRSEQQKKKANLSLCLISKRHDDVWGSEDIVPPFLISALDGGEWSASRLARFTSGERSPWYALDKRLGGPHSRSGRCGEDINLPLPGIEPGPSSP